MTTQHTRRHQRLAGLYVTLTVALLSLAAWARGEGTVDDRGSDSSEKAYMVIFAIAAGTAVSAAALTFLATKTALFK